MSKRNKNWIAEYQGQAGLFDDEIVEGALDVSLAFRAALSKALSASKESRYQQAGKVSELSRHTVSKDMLDKVVSSNLDYGLRAEDLPAVLAVIGSLEPLRVLLAPLGIEVLDRHEGELVKLARLQQDKARIEAEEINLRRKLGIR